MSKLSKLSKVNESFTINRYDNGFMVDIGGRNQDDDWETCKIICNTEAEVVELIKEAFTLPLDH